MQGLHLPLNMISSACCTDRSWFFEKGTISTVCDSMGLIICSLDIQDEEQL